MILMSCFLIASLPSKLDYFYYYIGSGGECDVIHTVTFC
jgi:hypothetical protein